MRVYSIPYIYCSFWVVGKDLFCVYYSVILRVTSGDAI